MKIFKMFFDIEKEEQWLNEQLQKGYRCINISGLGIYIFEKTDKNYVIRLDYQDYLPRKKLEEYKGVYEDFGWNDLKGSRISGKQYWQKEDDGQNEIFSDRQSKSNYYKRIMGYSFWLGLMLLAISLPYTDAKLYHEGLWSMNGSLFWKALFFETPFVLLKLSPAIMFIFFSTIFYKAYRRYSMIKN